MRQNSTTLSRQIDQKVKRGYYRPFFYVCLWFVGFGLLLWGYYAWENYRDRREWQGAPIEEGQAVCVRTKHIDSRSPTAWSNNTWANTFLVRGIERTSEHDQAGCVVGRSYQLRYRIGRSGRLQVESQARNRPGR